MATFLDLLLIMQTAIGLIQTAQAILFALLLALVLIHIGETTSCRGVGWASLVLSGDRVWTVGSRPLSLPVSGSKHRLLLMRYEHCTLHCEAFLTRATVSQRTGGRFMLRCALGSLSHLSSMYVV